MALNELYSQRILALAGSLEAGSRLPAPDATVKKTSRICGSSVEVDLVVENGVVSAYGHEVEACALGQTSAAVMANHIMGATPAELRALRDTMRAMLKQNGPPPDGRWDDLKYLQPVREFPPRHASTMLVFEAVVACLDQIEARESV